MVSWSVFHHVSRWISRPLHQAMPGFPAAEKSPLGSPSATSLPVELSLVWHQPEPLRALTLTHLQCQPLGRRLPAVGAVGGVQLPWAAEGLAGVAEVGDPQMKQGSQQHHWDDQVEVLGLKCREYELDVKHNPLQPVHKVTFPLPRPRPECMTSEQFKEARSTQKNGKRWLHQWSTSYSCVLLRAPVTDKLAFSLRFSLAGLVF